MKKCWRQSPEERPRSSELVATLDKTLQSVAGYIELSMTLDRGGDQEEEEEKDWSGCEVVQPTIETLTTAGMVVHNLTTSKNNYKYGRAMKNRHLEYKTAGEIEIC